MEFEHVHEANEYIAVLEEKNAGWFIQWQAHLMDVESANARADAAHAQAQRLRDAMREAQVDLSGRHVRDAFNTLGRALFTQEQQQ